MLRAFLPRATCILIGLLLLGSFVAAQVFGPPTSFPSGTPVTGRLVSGDRDGDNDIDIVCTSDNGFNDDRLYQLRNNGTGSFSVNFTAIGNANGVPVFTART
ncbi:MAG: hypothetical protein CMJ83_16280 [Planctomycetes bacterium]|nr:hypothetical protein [Planctomycetota bacterium]